MSIDDKIDDILTLNLWADKDGGVSGVDTTSMQLKHAFEVEMNKWANLRVDDYRAIGYRLKTLYDQYDHLTPAQQKGVLYEALCILKFKE